MRLYCSKRVDQNYRTRQGVYIIAKKWTMDKRQKSGGKKCVKIHTKRVDASILFQRSGPKLQNASERLYCSKEVDQPLFLGHFFTQDRRPIGRPLAPSPLTLRGDRSLRELKVRCVRSSKKQIEERLRHNEKTGGISG